MPSRRAGFVIFSRFQANLRADFAISAGSRWRTINHSTCQ
ncbi:hypothetical protein T12_449 [Trichinella patagoniensis]|uniref:Uncharacterized protein n=1 Tax=Trichinella patagoniensis TaxID=990121 RepID=A0A0V0YRB4_9BILA|nr:hypothetical protein T12_449 [Trichinella patagoniensis]